MYRVEDISAEECPLKVKAGSVVLEGSLCIPQGVKGIVLFAHGGVDGRRSSGNKYIARTLENVDIATLLVDLLTPAELAIDERTARLRFNIKLLTKRLIDITDWLPGYLGAKNMKMGYFGVGTGSAAAIISATERPALIRAIVSRGGRPDLAANALPRVKTPTLLIVGGKDTPVVEMNREALQKLKTEKTLAIIPGAGHLFEEPGAIQEVGHLAEGWFLRHFI
jgi:putative phosphoribosyl transferase